jgi:hypothetical protein
MNTRRLASARCRTRRECVARVADCTTASWGVKPSVAWTLAPRFFAARGNRQISRKPGTKLPRQSPKKNLRRVSAAWKNCLLGVSRLSRRAWQAGPNHLPLNDMHVVVAALAKLASRKWAAIEKVGIRRKHALRATIAVQLCPVSRRTSTLRRSQAAKPAAAYIATAGSFAASTANSRHVAWDCAASD